MHKPQYGVAWSASPRSFADMYDEWKTVRKLQRSNMRLCTIDCRFLKHGLPLWEHESKCKASYPALAVGSNYCDTILDHLHPSLPIWKRKYVWQTLAILYLPLPTLLPLISSCGRQIHHLFTWDFMWFLGSVSVSRLSVLLWMTWSSTTCFCRFSRCHLFLHTPTAEYPIYDQGISLLVVNFRLTRLSSPSSSLLGS